MHAAGNLKNGPNLPTRLGEEPKFRGTSHQKGQFPFTITGGQGIIVLPLSAIELRQRSSNVRISSGIPELDVMCGGGFFRDSVILVSGATGTGKTLLTTEFIGGGAEAGERRCSSPSRRAATSSPATP